MLDYYGINKSEAEIVELTGTTKIMGTNVNSLTRVAKQLGFKVVVKNNSNFTDIEKWLAKGVPPIVDWFTRGRQDYSDTNVTDGHYSVVCGIDDEYIYL